MAQSRQVGGVLAGSVDFGVNCLTRPGAADATADLPPKRRGRHLGFGSLHFGGLQAMLLHTRGLES